MKTIRASSRIVMLLLLSILCGGQQTNEAKETRMPNASDVTLDVVFRGPISFIQYQDGEMYGLIPQVKGHTYVSARARNSCELVAGTYAPSWPKQSNSTLDPGNDLQAELKIDASQETVNLNQSQLYVTLDLGKPFEVFPIHFDPATVWKQDPTATTEKFYPTGMVARYVIPSGSPMASTLPLSSNCQLSLEALGDERIAEISVGPLLEDNCKHKHAHDAFDSQKSSLAVNRSIKFPIPPGCPGVHFRATDCRTPMIVVVNVPNGSKPSLQFR